MRLQNSQNTDELAGNAITSDVTATGRPLSIQSVLKLIRVKHWLKNLFLFIPSFFAGHLFKTQELLLVSAGALSFSLVASAVYIINDYKDREVDKIHPIKKTRPLASGIVKRSAAIVLIIILLIMGFSLAAILNTTFSFLLAGYLILNIGYSFGLKHIPILDLFIVATGFLIRIYSGGVITGLPITHWLSLMVLLLALFLILAKRRDDVLISNKNKHAGEIRRSIKAYNLVYLNSCITLISSVTIVTYIMYTVSPEVTERFQSEFLYVTTIPVLAGIMRYLQIVFVEKKSGSPTNIFIRDRFILSTIAIWIISFYVIIYAI